ncbi:MAG: macro domain-containing protein [Arcanobacterium sp.]|nr:macro domain-containing protein [Arcanobacterium sp.]
MLTLADYRDVIELDKEFPIPLDDTRSDYDLLMTALSGLQDKHYTGTSSMAHLSTDEGLMRWLLAELSIRKPGVIDPITSRAINTLLYRRSGVQGRVEANHLRRITEQMPECDFINGNQVVLYRGDMTQLVVDAVVNTSLPELTGCDIPLHGCLDSVVHAQAGPWLRNDCAKIIELQGSVEEPAQAKITRGYRLPAKYIIHTHMPRISDGKITHELRGMLADCYRNALNLATEKGDIKSIAFPAIATGWNGFPIEEAAVIALKETENWLRSNTDKIDLVVFSVHSDQDAAVYQETLSTWVSD